MDHFIFVIALFLFSNKTDVDLFVQNPNSPGSENNIEYTIIILKESCITMTRAAKFRFYFNQHQPATPVTNICNKHCSEAMS